MTTLTIMRGISGSGKSTAAQELALRTGAAIVSRDDIRMAVFRSAFGESVDEDAVTDIEHAAIRSLLGRGRDVISDNTNLVQRNLSKIVNIGHEYRATVSVLTTDLPLEEALARNAARGEGGGRFVPESVIRRQYEISKKSYKIPEPVRLDPVEFDPSLPMAAIVDIDGTLALMDRAQRSPFEWHKVGLDELRIELAQTILALNAGGAHVLLLSGRDGQARKETEKWLEEFEVPYSELWMRAEGDMRPDTIVKKELFDEHVRGKFRVIGVWDDRPSVVRMWQAAGLPVNHVEPFNRDF